MCPSPLTEMGGDRLDFGKTRWSLVLRAGNPAEPEARQSLEHLIALYWKPVYSFIRSRWAKTNEEAKDATQEFFTYLLEKGILSAADPARGRFRSFLKTAVDNFLRNQYDAARALKRGGGAVRFSLDQLAPDGQLPAELPAGGPAPGGEKPEEAFDRQWQLTLLESALSKLEGLYGREGRPVYFQVLRQYDLDNQSGAASYEDVGSELGLTVTEVANYLHHARHRLRKLVEELVGEYVEDPAEVKEEIRELFG